MKLNIVAAAMVLLLSSTSSAKLVAVAEKDVLSFRNAINLAFQEITKFKVSCQIMTVAPPMVLSPEKSLEYTQVAARYILYSNVSVEDSNAQPALQLVYETGSKADNSFTRIILNLTTDITGTNVTHFQYELWKYKQVLKSLNPQFSFEKHEEVRCQAFANITQ